MISKNTLVTVYICELTFMRQLNYPLIAYIICQVYGRRM